MQTPIHVLIAGASGFLGTHLVGALEQRGHRVSRLVRRPAGPGEFTWSPDALLMPRQALDGVDAVVNLGGSPLIGNPHSSRWAHDVHASRVATTRTVAGAIAQRAARGESVPALLAGNGISFYGDHGADVITEDSQTRGDAFLTRVTRSWQDATHAAADAGARVCVLRTAVVIDRASMPFKIMNPLFRAGLGARLGRGDQYFPIVSRRDWVDSVVFLAESHTASGAYNITCPVPPTNAEFSAAMAGPRRVLLAVPAPLLRRGAGALAPELLNSVRATPERLLMAGHTFTDPDVHAITSAALNGL